MRRLGRLLCVLAPTPLAGFVAVIAALGTSYVLLIGLHPEPRFRITLQALDCRRDSVTVSGSLDGKTLIFDRHPWRRHVGGLWESALLLNVTTGAHFEITQPIWCLVFASDGNRFAAATQEGVAVWDWTTNDRPNRYPLNHLRVEGYRDRQLAFVPKVGFICCHSLPEDKNGESGEILFVVETNKPWEGTRREFAAHQMYQTPEDLGGRSTSDLRFSYAYVGGNRCTVLENKTGIARHVQLPPDVFGCIGIAPDGQTVIAPTQQWGLLRKAQAYFEYVYRGGNDPEPVPGAVCVDVATGQETDFVPGNGQFFFTPDGGTFVSLASDPDDPSRSMLTVYDWPLRRPWLRVLCGTALVFISIVAISKAWRWYRGTPPTDQADTRPAKPPWETATSPPSPELETPGA